MVVVTDWHNTHPVAAEVYTILLAHFNSALNPILYGIFNPLILKGYKNVFNMIVKRSNKIIPISFVTNNTFNTWKQTFSLWIYIYIYQKNFIQNFLHFIYWEHLKIKISCFFSLYYSGCQTARSLSFSLTTCELPEYSGGTGTLFYVNLRHITLFNVNLRKKTSIYLC